jgi:hypothetical protein
MVICSQVWVYFNCETVTTQYCYNNFVHVQILYNIASQQVIMKVKAKFIFLITLSISLGQFLYSCSSPKAEEETKSPDPNLSEVAGIYQMYVDGEPLNQNGQMFYLLNAQGVVLTSFGESATSAFQDVNQGLNNGLITTGTFKISGSNLTFELEKSSGPTEWKLNKLEKTISRDRASLRYIQEIR